jgi:hypothetical protein
MRLATLAAMIVRKARCQLRSVDDRSGRPIRTSSFSRSKNTT